MAAHPADPRAQGWNGSGIDVGENARDACTHRWRGSGAIDLPVLRSWVRTAHLSQERQTDLDRRRSGEPDQSGEPLSERRRFLSITHPQSPRDENEISRAAREGVDGNFAR